MSEAGDTGNKEGMLEHLFLLPLTPNVYIYMRADTSPRLARLFSFWTRFNSLFSTEPASRIHQEIL